MTLRLKKESTSPEPHYVRLADELRRQVKTGILQPNDQLPSFAVMREKYGVYQPTLEKVYRLLENEGLIVRSSRRGTFVTTPAARPQTGLLGFLGSDFSENNNSFYSFALSEGIRDRANHEKCRILSLTRDYGLGWDKVEGVLVHNVPEQEEFMQRLPLNLPGVSLLEPAAGCSSVLTDDYGGAQSAVRHLTELGHQRIGFVTERAGYILEQRLSGYSDALQQFGTSARPGWIRPLAHRENAPLNYREAGRFTIEKWLREGWREMGCTALLAQNDWTAIGIIEGLQAAGMRVPEDVSIIGFDGTEACTLFTPQVTAVEIPLSEAGRAGVELLIGGARAGAGLDGSRVKTVSLPTKLQIRQSTGPVAQA